jgi:hypothetical protein
MPTNVDPHLLSEIESGFPQRQMDCFAEPVIGRVRATRWLAVTASGSDASVMSIAIAKLLATAIEPH